MYDDFKIETEKATVDYVLRVFQDQHRQGVALGEADEDITITFDTTIADWRDADDLITWRELAKALNKGWCTTASRAEWRAVLEPARSKTLRGVCELIAREAVVPKLTPATVFGVKCESAGAFFAVRKMLADSGADVSEITPSTPLAPYARRYWSAFLGPIASLSPGALPVISCEEDPIHTVTGCGLGLSAILTLVSLVISIPELQVVAVGLFCISAIAGWVAGLSTLPRSVTFGNLATFRDLAKALVANATAARCL